VANDELSTFAYSVSHDLRAPLRAIDGFSAALCEDHAASLDADARRSLGKIRESTQRMGHLIDDLLTLSRVTRVPVQRQRIDLAVLDGRWPRSCVPMIRGAP
jgi:signal transduction histidine kinase